MADSLHAPETGEPGAPPERFEPPSFRRLLRAHKRASAIVAGIVILLIVLALVADLNSRVSRISDSTPCSVWGSAPQNERDAYAALYVKRHGPLPSGASDSGTIEGVIDDGCTRAYGFDEADTVNVLQALRHQY